MGRRLIPGEGRPDPSHSGNHSRCVGDGPDSETPDALPEVTIAVSGGPIARPRGAVVLVLLASQPDLGQ